MKTFIDENAEKGVMIINGQTINLFALEPRQIQLSRLVRGLQGVIRFNGYSDYSVAQHSFVLSLISEVATKQLLSSGAITKETFNLFSHFGFSLQDMAQHNKVAQFLSSLMAYDALIHDLSEALTGDIIRPFKRLLPEIGEMEARIDLQIRKHHSALSQIPLLVDILDKQLATFEAYYLTRYYAKTLINELDPFQTRSFNSVFGNEKPLSAFVAKTCFNIELGDLELPISDSALFNIAKLAQCEINGIKHSVDSIKAMSNEELLTAYIERAEKLKDTLRTCFDEIKAYCIINAETFEEYMEKVGA